MYQRLSIEPFLLCVCTCVCTQICDAELFSIPETNFFSFFRPPAYTINIDERGVSRRKWNWRLVDICSQELSRVIAQPAVVTKVLDDDSRHLCYYVFEFAFPLDLRYVCIYDLRESRFICMASLPFPKEADGSAASAPKMKSSVTHGRSMVSQDTNVCQETIDEELLTQPIE